MPDSEFKIKLQKQVYSKAEVEKICAIFQTELNISIDTAFNEGYKQGLLASAPDAQFYKTLSEDLEKEVKRLNSWRVVPWWSVPVSIICGTALGVTLSFIR